MYMTNPPDWRTLSGIGTRSTNVGYLDVSVWPTRLQQGDPITSKLIRLQRLQERFANFLYDWTPTELSSTWKAVLKIFTPTLSAEGHIALQGRRALFHILHKHPEIIPCIAAPECIFLLLSLGKFERAWHRWLGPNLKAIGYSVINDHADLGGMYQEMMRSVIGRLEGKDSWLSHFRRRDGCEPILKYIHTHHASNSCLKTNTHDS
ncbi:hypothetical protein BDZ89DRAFT_1149372 [Hymenopellis radicata]|nr:hypothetical protein BDZ89DRAFT_1149372 [Hymenopellis radicata]